MYKYLVGFFFHIYYSIYNSLLYAVEIFGAKAFTSTLSGLAQWCLKKKLDFVKSNFSLVDFKILLRKVVLNKFSTKKLLWSGVFSIVM